MKNEFNNLMTKRGWELLCRWTLILTIGLFLSCEKDILDLKPTEAYSNEAIWQDEALIEAYANYAYKTLPWGFQRLSYRIMPYANMTDESSSRGSLSTIGLINTGNQSPAFSGPMNVWTTNGRNYWDPISQANRFLVNIEVSPIEKQDFKDKLIGEMKALRAYSYFMLISHYGGVPLITTPFSLDDDFNVTRNSYDEVMSFVLTELDEAIEILPLVNEPAGRITKGAAMSMKSRALLYNASSLNNPENDQQKWQNAADAAKAVIDLNAYILADDYKNLFTEEGGYSTKEIIWGRPQNVDIEIETILERRLFPNGWAGYAGSHPLQNLVKHFETTNGLQPEDDPDFDPQNPYVNRDPRFYATILYDGAPFKERTVETFLPGGLDTADGINSPWNASETGYYYRKFIDEDVCGCSGDASGNSAPTWIYFRYAEVLLNYAEASYMVGDEATAREYINLVRSRPSVDMPDVTETGNALFERIVNERRIELVFEEHRFFDVRRWKIAEEVLTKPRLRMVINKDPATGDRTFTEEEFQPAGFNEWNYLAPIPQEVIDQNSEIQQNPGY